MTDLPEKEAAPGVVTHAEGHELKPSQASLSIVAQAVLDEYYPPGTLRHHNGDFYHWDLHEHLGGYFSRIPRRALAPFIYRTLQAKGQTASGAAVREVALALSALPDVLVDKRPRPTFGDALNAKLQQGQS